MTRAYVQISKRMLFVYLLLGGLIFLFLPTGVTGGLQLVYASLFRVPLAAGRALILAARTPTEGKSAPAQDYEDLRTANQALENQKHNLDAELALARKKIDDLAGIRNHHELDRMGFIQAGIIADAGQGQDELLVKCGQDDGVAVGQYVLADASVIGTISAVKGQIARVRLISNPGSRIPVRIAGSNARGFMVGRGAGRAAITQVSAKQEVKTGDVVFALNVPGFPEVSIVTAKVVDRQTAKDAPRLLWDIVVRPVCDIAILERVEIIVPRK